jgi:putative ABC transport system substrate-binding protein
VTATPSTLHAQSSGKVARVATLWTTSRTVAQPYLDAIQDGLRELGWDAGRNIVFDNRFTDGKPDSLPVLAAEIVALRPDVAVAPLNPAALALKRLTGTMPIIFVVAIDPVGTGLAASLGHPGGNATGTTVAGPETAAKRLQMLRELAPTARRVGIVGNAAFPGFDEVRSALDNAASGLGFVIVNGTASDAGGFVRALESMSAQRVDALLVLGDNLTHLHLREIVSLATRTRIPSVYSQQEFCDGGGLACYGVDLQANYRRSAVYIDKVLRGVPPAAIPIETPRAYNFVINLRTARALGIEVLPTLKVRADRLIE